MRTAVRRPLTPAVARRSMSGDAQHAIGEEPRALTPLPPLKKKLSSGARGGERFTREACVLGFKSVPRDATSEE